MVSKEKIPHFKQKLEEEMRQLVKELQSVGRINPDNPEDWEAVSADLSEPASADLNDNADEVEAYGEHVAILDQLETRFNEVKDALRNIDEGEYGICNVCGANIEEDRLEANPAAVTCKTHIEQS